MHQPVAVKQTKDAEMTNLPADDSEFAPVSVCECGCGRFLEADEVVEEGGRVYHHEHASKAVASIELAALVEQVESLAAQHGWEVAETSRAKTGTVYVTLEKTTTDEDECDSTDRITVRCADHQACYCREDVSLVVPSVGCGADDHSIETLIKKLS